MENTTPAYEYALDEPRRVTRHIHRWRLFAIGLTIGAALYILPTLV